MGKSEQAAKAAASPVKPVPVLDAEIHVGQVLVVWFLLAIAGSCGLPGCESDDTSGGPSGFSACSDFNCSCFDAPQGLFDASFLCLLARRFIEAVLGTLWHWFIQEHETLQQFGREQPQS